MNPKLLQTTRKYIETLQRLGKKETVLSGETWKKLQELASRPSPSLEMKRRKSSTAPTHVTYDKSGESDSIRNPLSFSLKGNRLKDLEALRELALPCTRCPHLAKTRTQVVFGVGNPDAELMFVGEAPGADEDAQGEPFVGRAGQLLTKMIEAMGLKRENVYIANVLKCRPDMPLGSSGNRKPTAQEMATCLPYLKYQIQIIQPKVMVALGATAVEGLLGLQKIGITALRGQWKEFEHIPLMPTFHPSYLLRDQSIEKKRMVWEDLLEAMDKLGLPISEKQKKFFTRPV